MLLKKKNTLVGIINLILGILGCLWLFICNSCINQIEHSYISTTDMQDTLATIFAVIMLIPLALTLIINIIYIFRNWHNKKNVFMNILAIILIVTSTILVFVFEDINFAYINSIVLLSGIFLLIFNKTEEDNKKHRLLFGIMIINIIIPVISSIVFLCIKNNFKITYTNNEKNMLKCIMQTSNNTNNKPIKARKSGKYGYIDSHGNIVIDFVYDDCSDFVEINVLNTNKKYYIAEVSFGNEIRFITNDNKTICTHKNSKSKKKLSVNYIPNSFLSKLKENAKELNTNINIVKDTFSYSYDYDYDASHNYNTIKSKYTSNNVIAFEIPNKEGKTIELLYNHITKNVIYNNINIKINGQLGVYKNDSTSSYIYSYKNGYIPIYNFEKNIFGWIDLNGQAHYINGKKQILDFNNKYIAIKDYAITSNTKAYLIDYTGNKVSDFYQEISFLDNGYIAKKENGKNIYLDDNLKQISQEYDIINDSIVKDGILIVSNYNSSSLYETNTNNMEFNLLNINNGQIIGQNFEYISGLDDYKYTSYKNSKYDNYTDYCNSLIFENINTQFYNMFYN